jgi:hypothetical protein
MWIRSLALSAFAGAMFFACGGRTDGLSSPSSSSSGSSGGTSSGSSGGTSSGSSSGDTSTGSSSGFAPRCVFVDVGTYDRSCNTPSDCAFVTGGEVCDGSCDGCGSDLVSASELPRYDAAISRIHLATCRCGVPPPVGCIDHQCTSGDTSADAGGAEASACVNIDLSTYDRSCKADSDCIQISSGMLCSPTCLCGGSAINIDGQARYDDAIAPLEPGLCPCPFLGPTRCVAGECTVCGVGPNPFNCPDGG